MNVKPDGPGETGAQHCEPDRNYHYSPIAYHDTWISVDPIVGCQLNCQYCYMQMTGWAGVKPRRLFSPPEIVDLLLAHKYFTPHETVLGFGNQTDAFLAANSGYTLEFFKLLEEKRLRNPVTIVTKKQIPAELIKAFCELEHVRPVFCLTYSGLPRSIEKGVEPEESRSNFRNLAAAGLRVLHFWRPLVVCNGTAEVLREILGFVSEYALASVYEGLKLNPFLAPVYDRDPRLKVPAPLTNRYGVYIPEGVEERLKSLVEKERPDYPLYRHTSCAVSLALAIPDFNATLYREPICQGSRCPAWKRGICEAARSKPGRQEVRDLLTRADVDCEFEITDDAVQISGEITQEDYTFLLHRINFPLEARKILYYRVVRGSIFTSNSSRKPPGAVDFKGQAEGE